MYTDGLHEHSRLEEEYFYKKERELIDNMKEKEKQKQELLERTQHYHKCGKCGHDMAERGKEEISLLVCSHCESIHISMANLSNLNQHHKLKLVLAELQDGLKQLKESA